MGVFVYHAIDRAGKVITGNIEADSEQLVLAKLHELNYHIIGISERKKRAAIKVGSGSKKVKLQSIVVFSRQFSTMVNAGISLIRCLDILENQTKDPVLKEVVGMIKHDVTGGANLTESFSKHQNIFSKLYVSMIRSAEIGGVLGDVLDRLSDFLENEMEIRAKIKSAMIYPVAVLCFAVVMVGVMMVVVLPTFKGIFTEMGVEMPPATKALFAVSGFVVSYWYILIGLALGGVFAFRAYGRTPAGRKNIDGLKLKIPLVGEIIQKMSIARFARTFGTLVNSGVPMMRCLEVVSETAGNVVISQAVEDARNSVREGQKISRPLANSGLFPEMVTQMIDIGEETGKLSDMLNRVATFYDKEVDGAVKALTSLIEPMLIIVMGGVVGFIAISIMSPIFKLISSIN
jgi:type IV pilus assembly protein PilC